MRLRRDIIHKTTGLGFSKRWVSFHKTTRIFFEGFSHPFFRSGVWVSAFVRSESARRLFDGFEQGLNRVWTGFAQCLFNGCSMAVQWLFNGCSMVGERLSPCVASAVFCCEHECGRCCCLWFVSHEFFWWLRIEFIWVVVFPGRHGKEGVSRCTFWIHPRRCVREGVWLSLETFFPQWRHRPNVFCPEERKAKRHSAR